MSEAKTVVPCRTVKNIVFVPPPNAVAADVKSNKYLPETGTLKTNPVVELPILPDAFECASPYNFTISIEVTPLPADVAVAMVAQFAPFQ